jgi:hypothetical protein
MGFVKIAVFRAETQKIAFCAPICALIFFSCSVSRAVAMIYSSGFLQENGQNQKNLAEIIKKGATPKKIILYLSLELIFMGVVKKN